MIKDLPEAIHKGPRSPNVRMGVAIDVGGSYVVRHSIPLVARKVRREVARKEQDGGLTGQNVNAVDPPRLQGTSGNATRKRRLRLQSLAAVDLILPLPWALPVLVWPPFRVKNKGREKW